MTFSKLILVGVAGLALHGPVSAQIYESEDAEGVPEFSDTPTAGSHTVDLPETNLAEPPPAQEAPRAPDHPAAPAGDATAGAPGAAEGVYGGVYYGGDDEARVRRGIDEDRIHDAVQQHPESGLVAPAREGESRAREMEGAAPVEHVERGAVHHKAGGHR